MTRMSTCMNCGGSGKAHSPNDQFRSHTPGECWVCTGTGRVPLPDDEERVPVEAAHREQEMPIKHDGPCIQDMVIADIEKRKAIGLQRYGSLLQPNNGRDALRDLYEELMDACQYIRQVIYERDNNR